MMEMVNFNKNKILSPSKIKYEIAKQLLLIFRKHIGFDNSITKDELFKKLFDKDYNPNDVKDYIRWDFVKKAMHLLRTKTKCFIITERYEGESYIYVINEIEEAKVYIDILDNNINKMRLMQKRAQKAIKEKWHKLDWDDKKLIK
jgi:hypothetical protein